MALKVWISGEGNNELGRHDGYGGRLRGVLEALLARVSTSGWSCVHKLPWNQIRKFRAGGARRGVTSHGDYLNVLGLVLLAQEAKADVIAFSRDVDSDPDRARAVAAALDRIETESGWHIAVIGGVAQPALEGWILALRAVPNTDDMSRRRTLEHLEELEITAKSTEAYVDIVDTAGVGAPQDFGLPNGSDSLRAWLTRAHEVLNQSADDASL